MSAQSQSASEERVIIGGREFQVQRSSVLMEGETEPNLGVVFNVATIECPMSIFEGTRVRQCGAWMDLGLDFAPIAYVCQSCAGIVVVDVQTESSWYGDADSTEGVTDALGLYFYYAGNERTRDSEQFRRWLSRRSPSATLAVATIHNREMRAYFDRVIGKGRRLVMPRFYALDELRPELQPYRKPDITTVAQLDALINAGGGVVTRSVMSPEMERLLEQYASASRSMQQGQLGEAVQGYLRIVSMWPSFVAARVNLANCLMGIGKPREALAQLRRAHGVAPGDPDVHLAAGRAYERMGDKEKELQEYQKALGDDPRSVDGMNNLGATYREVGQLELAEQWLMRALEEVASQRRSEQWKHNWRLAVQYNLALTYQDGGDWGRAVECWQACLSLARANPELHRALQWAQTNAQRASSSRVRRWFNRT